jgi:hypothetical protein
MTRTRALILGKLRPRARRLALWMERNWARGRTSPDQGLAITAGEVARILEAPAEAAAERADFAASAEIAAFAAPIAEADQALAADETWRRLCDNFALPAAEADLLALALAEALDPEFGRVIAYLNDDARQTKATPWLAAKLCQDSGPALHPAALLRWRLVAPVDGHEAGLPATPYQADPACVACIVHGVWTDASLTGIAAFEDLAQATAMPVLYPAALARMREGGGAKSRFDLLGAEGSGRRVLAAQFAAAAGRDLVVMGAATIAWRAGDCLSADDARDRCGAVDPPRRADAEIARRTDRRPGHYPGAAAGCDHAGGGDRHPARPADGDDAPGRLAICERVASAGDADESAADTKRDRAGRRRGTGRRGRDQAGAAAPAAAGGRYFKPAALPL